MTTFKKVREAYKPPIPSIFKDLKHIHFEKKEEMIPSKDVEEIKKIFPNTFGKKVLETESGEGKKCRTLKVGVVLSGGQAPGGHNVIAGLFDGLKTFNPNSTLYGFLGGPQGIIDAAYKEIKAEELQKYRNEGGFHFIGSGRTKIETQEQLKSSLRTCRDLQLDGLVIIGGDDSNTNAAILAEYFIENASTTSIVGVPKTIDGDLKNAYVDISFGFDTACKIYSEMIGNLGKDALSAKKYYHFIKLMGRSASHITLECALRTRPNVAFIAEEVFARKMTLNQIKDFLADMICKRAEKEKNYGLILIPEGLIEFIPEIKILIKELNAIFTRNFQQLTTKEKIEKVKEHLTPPIRAIFESIPYEVKEQLLLDLDPHGNVQVSKISTEKLLLHLVEKELKHRKESGLYKGTFSSAEHFFGYEGRSGYPSNFDAKYCYALGLLASLLVKEEETGYMSAISNLSQNVESWKAHAIPLTGLMRIEMRSGKTKPVIQKALVDLEGKTFKTFKKERDKWLFEDDYQSPGPIQFFGDPEITDQPPISI